MKKKIIRFSLISFACISTASFLLAQTGVNSFYDIISGGQPSSSKILTEQTDLSSENADPLRWNPADWQYYILAPSYQPLLQGVNGTGSADDAIDVNTYGSMRFNLGYGSSHYTNKKYRTSDQDTPQSRVITQGLTPEQQLLLHMEGKIGRRITVYIDHDSRRRDNHYLMQYRAVEDDEVIREINAGEIDIKFNNSKYAVYDNSTAKGLGVDMTVRKDRLQVKAFGSVMQGEVAVEYFRGNSSSGAVKLEEYRFIRGTYYQLEPFRRYDNLSSPPSSVSDVYSSRVMTSQGTETLYPVNISTNGLEIYMDDQDARNNYGGMTLELDNGYYRRLSSGTDYTISFDTGLITMLKPVPDKSRIFVLYKLASGTTSDPCALAPAETGNPSSDCYFTFIKYGYSLNEDTQGKDLVSEGDRNGDGRINLDIYEVRSFYSTGDKGLLQEGFSLSFYDENRTLSRDEISSLGGYSVDYTNGIIRFNRREPFKKILGSTDSGIIYCENQVSSAKDTSRYGLKIDYYMDRRSFQLQHGNVIPGSVRIRVNNRDLSPTLYSVDPTSGFLVFLNPDTPVIAADTNIEIRYEYLPYASQSGSFVGGTRADYTFNRYFKLGGSALFTRNGSTQMIPDIANAPASTTVIEGDASLFLDGKKISDMAERITGGRYGVMPVEFSSYGEYARSYSENNRFGKCLFDIMDSGDQSFDLPVSEKNWQMGSLPAGTAQADRGILNYRYYRDPSDPGDLKGLSYSAALVPYSTKPGPYNVATGHIDNSVIKSTNQKSLVFEYDLSAAGTVSVATGRFSGGKTDLSGMKYIEISYRLEAGEGSGSVGISLDLGHINEDSDGDGILDTEDVNVNGVIDYDSELGYSEDRGYQFNGNNATVVGAGPGLSGMTRGDGVLNSEDLNGNGTLEDFSSEEIYSTGSQTIETGTGRWQVLRIYTGNLTSSQKDILSRVESVRLTITRGTSTGGKLFIDHMRCVSSSWKDVPGAASTARLTMVNSLVDEDYRADAFIFSRGDVYQSLYGKRSSDELKAESESALKVQYTTSSGDPVSVERRFVRAMDMRFYKALAVWINPRSMTAGDVLEVIVGSSDTDYVAYRVPLENIALWQEIRLRKKGDSGPGYQVVSENGEIDYRRINTIRFQITSTSAGTGEIWINDIYAAESVTTADSAHWFENEIRITEPLYRKADGTPVISDITVRYLAKGNGEDFNSVGKATTETGTSMHQLFTSCSILPQWKTSMDYFQEETTTDSLNTDVPEDSRGKCLKKSFLFSSDYVSTGMAPSLRVGYRMDRLDGERREIISSANVRTLRESVSHAPFIDLRENLNNMLGGTVQALYSMTLLFRNEQKDRDSQELAPDQLAQQVSIKDREMRQRSNATLSLKYFNRLLFFKPEVTASSEEIVEAEGSGCANLGLESSVNGSYHVPFVYSDDMRFLSRYRKAAFSAGYTQLEWLRPEYRIDFSSAENSFRDYSADRLSVSGLFNREKNALSSLGTTLTLPFGPGIAGKGKFFRNLNLVFRRNVSLEETDIPYEGEGTAFLKEEYGFRRVFSGLSGAGYNIFRYFPGYFLTGRKSAAAARDYTHSTLNEQIIFPGGTSSGYSNRLKLIDDLSLQSGFDFNRFSISMGAGISALSERKAIDSVPEEVLTKNVNTRFSFNLMKIFSFWFFRPNNPTLPYHAAMADMYYDFSRFDLITSAIREDRHIPGLGLTLKWNRSSLGFIWSIEYRLRSIENYISTDDSKRDSRDDIYIENLPDNSNFRERDTGYNFSVIYETDVPWLYNIFLNWYELTARPVFNLKYTMALNRYNYNESVSPEPYDLHRFDAGLTMDLHRNVQGGLTSTLALERFYSRETGGLSRQIFSYALNFNFSLIF